MKYSFVHPLFILGVGIDWELRRPLHFASTLPKPPHKPSPLLIPVNFTPLVETLSGAVVNITVSMDQQPIHPILLGGTWKHLFLRDKGLFDFQ